MQLRKTEYVPSLVINKWMKKNTDYKEQLLCYEDKSRQVRVLFFG